MVLQFFWEREVMDQRTCLPSMTFTIFYSLVWGFLPSLILATLVLALYRGIQGLKNEVTQMDHENIRNNESLKEYKFRTKLLMGIVTVFIVSSVIFTTYLVSQDMSYSCCQKVVLRDSPFDYSSKLVFSKLIKHNFERLRDSPLSLELKSRVLVN